MQGKVAKRALMALVAWIVVGALGGYLLGQYAIHSLGPQILLAVGVWAGSIAGLFHVLLVLINSRPARPQA